MYGPRAACKWCKTHCWCMSTAHHPLTLPRDSPRWHLSQCSRELFKIQQLPDDVSALEIPWHADVLWGRRPLSERGSGVSLCAASTPDPNCAASVVITEEVGAATIVSDCVAKLIVRVSVPHERFLRGNLTTLPFAVRRLDPPSTCQECTTVGVSRIATCSDGIDNDGDQLVDTLDASCRVSPWASESTNKASCLSACRCWPRRAMTSRGTSHRTIE